MTSHSRAPQWIMLAAIAVALFGCGSAPGSGLPAPDSALAAPTLTSVSAVGTSSEPSTVTAEARTDGMVPVTLSDGDADPLAWSITAATPAGDTVLVITATDAAGNVRTSAMEVSIP